MKKGYDSIILKALGFFVENPYESIHLREFARRVKISVNSSQRFLLLFLRNGFIKEERKANLRYFRANLDSVVFRQMKVTFVVKELEDSGLIDSLKDLASYGVLFGSSATGKDNRSSDIDLVIIGKDKEALWKVVRKIQNKISRELNAHIFSLAEWRKQKTENKAFYQEVLSGINLIGEMPWM